MRLLALHPQAGLEVITSRTEAGRAASDYFPSLRGVVDRIYVKPDTDALFGCDVVFFATPNGTAMQSTPALLDKGIRVIDLSADFRLQYGKAGTGRNTPVRNCFVKRSTGFPN